VIDLPDVVSGLCDAAAATRPLRYAAARVQGRAAERVERQRLAAFAAILTINAADAARLRALGLEPTTVPLAVEVPDEAGLAATGPAPLHVLFVASFEHLPNREAARFIARRLVPALRRRAVPARVTVAGRGARDMSLPAGEERAASPATASQRVTLEVVSDPLSLAPLYRRADVVIVPLAFGGGTKNKTLEAMGWSRPVVGSAQAFTGLPDELRGVAYVQTPLDADAMADALARLAADAALRERLGRAGREYVLAEHTQARVDAVIDEVYERVLRTGAGAAGAPT
jgi:polysaccharide biosynthesis protein PslH